MSNNDQWNIDLHAINLKECCSDKDVFKELQKSTGMKNYLAAKYLGISLGALKARRTGELEARESELIALAVYGSRAEELAQETIKELREEIAAKQGK